MLTEGQIDSTLVFPGVWVLLCVAEIVVMRTLLEMVSIFQAWLDTLNAPRLGFYSLKI